MQPCEPHYLLQSLARKLLGSLPGKQTKATGRGKPAGGKQGTITKWQISAPPLNTITFQTGPSLGTENLLGVKWLGWSGCREGGKTAVQSWVRQSRHMWLAGRRHRAWPGRLSLFPSPDARCLLSCPSYPQCHLHSALSIALLLEARNVSDFGSESSTWTTYPQVSCS